MANVNRLLDGTLVACVTVTCPKCQGGMGYHNNGTIFRGGKKKQFYCEKCKEDLHVHLWEEGFFMGQYSEKRKWDEKIFKLFDLEPREECD